MTYQDSTRHPVTTQLLIRLFSRIEISTTLFYEGSACWEWVGCLTKGGYASIYYDHPERNKKLNNYGGHRMSYELFVGQIPPTFEVDHLCRVRHCVNPAHLEAVTRQENNRRSTSFTAVNAAKTHCLRGHLLTGDNLIERLGVKGKPMRNCRECQRIKGKIQSQKWRDARKAKGLTTNPYSKKRLVNDKSPYQLEYV